jgi:ferredoxin-type protein NapH
MKDNKSIELKTLKIILWSYIILCLIIAGLNYGYAGKASASIGAYITWLWHFYENGLKTAMIVLCSFLTYRIIRTSSRTTMRKRNLIGFVIAALVVHIFAPFFLDNKELYFFAMPLPWTTTPLQLLDVSSTFYNSRIAIWGISGISTALLFYVGVCIVVLLGTLLFGRRWQCSTLCLFNGFAAEVFAPAFPLLGKHKAVKPTTLKFLSITRWAFLSIAILLTLLWSLHITGISSPLNMDMLTNLEVYKYLSTELLMMMFFWIAFIGRGYCYYCPLGTVLAMISRGVGQKIRTDNTECINCNQCNLACPMTIDIRSNAQYGIAVSNLRCVGCGRCVDSCPTNNLSYTTKFLSRRIR